MDLELIALKTFSHSIGAVEEGALFKASPTYARSLVEGGFAQLASTDPGSNGPWGGCSVVIMASGPSLNEEDIEAVRRWRESSEKHRVLVICLTYKKALWADAVYAADDIWWDKYNDDVVNTFQGERWSQSEYARRKYGTNFIQCERREGLSRIPNVIHSGGNSGYQGVGLVYQRGARKIVLLGFDMQKVNGKSHHHDPYPAGFPSSSPYDIWRERFTSLAYELRQHRTVVLNSTRVTALDCFEKVPLHEALNEFDRETKQLNRVPALAYCMLKEGLHYRRSVFESGLSKLGCRVRSGPPTRFDKEVLAVMWNRYGANHDIATKVEAGGGVVVVAENGYLAKGGGTPKYDGGYYAMALSGHNGNGQWKIGGDERLKELELDIKPWRRGDYVLVCPNRSFGTPGTVMPVDWAQQVKSALKQYTDRQIKIRPHPGNDEPKIPFSEDLKYAAAVVIWSSSCGVHALVDGVPVFQCAPRWICMPATSLNLSMIEDPACDDDRRLSALHGLSWAQWNADEIASGKAFKNLLGAEGV